MNREHVESVVTADLRRANAYFEETVEPLLLERRDIYLASKEYYNRKFPELSKKTDYRSFDFYAYVQWAKSPILASVFGTSRAVQIVGCGPDDDNAAKLMERLVEWQMTQQCTGYEIIGSWVEDALIYEFGILKVWWERSTNKREFDETFPMEQFSQLTQDPDVEIKEVGQPDYFGDVSVKFDKEFLLSNKAKFDNVSPFDMRWSPEARTLETANFVAQRQRMSISELTNGIEQFGYDAKVVKEVSDGAGTTSNTTSDIIRNPEIENIKGEEDRARNLVDVYECYVKIDTNNDGILESYIVTIADERVLRIIPNGFEQLPYFQLTAHTDRAKVFPTDISMAGITGELQNLRTAMVRQLEINLSISNRPRVFIDEQRVNMDDFLSDRVFIRCSDTPSNVTMPEQPTQIAGWTMDFFELTKGFEEEWTGRTRYNQGMQADTLNKTASGINMIMKASSQRIEGITKKFAETGFKPALKFLILLDQRYMDEKQMMRVFNDVLEVAPDDIHGDLDVVVETDVGSNKRQQEITVLEEYLKEVYPYAIQFGIVGPQNFEGACIRAMELSGLADASKYFLTEQEKQQQQMEQQQLQQQRQVMSLVSGAAQSGGTQTNSGGPVDNGGNGQQGQRVS